MKSLKFHWTVRWIAHFYNRKDRADYFLEYDAWRLSRGEPVL